MTDPETTWSKCRGIAVALVMAVFLGVAELARAVVCGLTKAFNWLSDLDDRLIDWADRRCDRFAKTKPMKWVDKLQAWSDK